MRLALRKIGPVWGRIRPVAVRVRGGPRAAGRMNPPCRTLRIKSAALRFRMSTGVHLYRSPRGVYLRGRYWTQVNCNSNCNQAPRRAPWGQRGSQPLLRPFPAARGAPSTPPRPAPRRHAPCGDCGCESMPGMSLARRLEGDASALALMPGRSRSEVAEAAGRYGAVGDLGRPAATAEEHDLTDDQWCRKRQSCTILCRPDDRSPRLHNVAILHFR